MNSGHEKLTRPFVFEQSFDILESPEELEAMRKKKEEEAAPTFTEEELKEAQEIAHKDGIQEGLRQALTSIEQQVMSTLDVIGLTLDRLDVQQKAANDLIARETIDLAVASVEKLLPQFVLKVGTQEVESFIHDILSRILEEPTIVITVSEELASEVERNMIDLANKIGFSGDITVVGDTSLGAADCRIRWTEGEAERLLESTRREINAVAASTPRYEAHEFEITADAPAEELSSSIPSEMDRTLSSKPETPKETETEALSDEATAQRPDIAEIVETPQEIITEVSETDIGEKNTDETLVDQNIQTAQEETAAEILAKPA